MPTSRVCALSTVGGLVALLAGVCCGGTTSPATPDGGDHPVRQPIGDFAPGSDAGGVRDAFPGTDACTLFSTIQNRRTQAAVCSMTPAPDAALPPYGGGNLDGGSPDLCLADVDCADGGVCSCRGTVRGWSGASNGNVCIEGNCRVDSDCGPGGACSPTFGDCGGFYGYQGYYCHTCADECLNDSDCVDDVGDSGYCMFDPTVGHWSCGFQRCAG